MSADYDKVGLFAMRNGRVLLCRKKALGPLILPGGVREQDEASLECLRRELHEELGPVEVCGLELLGDYKHAAATAGKTVRIELYSGEIRGEPMASSEIAELVWFAVSDDWRCLAPSLSESIFPDLIARGILS